jgi:hypothetical protein
VRTTAQNGKQLAALVDAVRGLPRDPHRLDEILMDLAMDTDAAEMGTKHSVPH